MTYVDLAEQRVVGGLGEVGQRDLGRAVGTLGARLVELDLQTKPKLSSSALYRSLHDYRLVRLSLARCRVYTVDLLSQFRWIAIDGGLTPSRLIWASMGKRDLLQAAHLFPPPPTDLRTDGALEPPNVALLAFRSSTDRAGRSATTRSLTGRACRQSESQRS